MCLAKEIHMHHPQATAPMLLEPQLKLATGAENAAIDAIAIDF